MVENEKLKRYEVLDRLIEAGLSHFTIHKLEVQDKHIVSMSLMIDDKEVKITR